MTVLRLALLLSLVAAPAFAARLFDSTVLRLASPGSPSATWFADLDNDGDDDLVVPIEQGGIAVARAIGGGSFAPWVQTLFGHGSLYGHIADVDGDGYLDLAGQCGDGPFVAFGDGTTGWSQFLVLPVAVGPTEVGDLDGDGRADLVVRKDNSISVYRGDAARTFPLAGTWPSLGIHGNAVFANITGSPAVDLLVGNPSGVSVYEGNGDGTLGTRTDYPIGTDVIDSYALAPLDGTPGLDLVDGGVNLGWRSGIGGSENLLDTSNIFVWLSTTWDVNGDGKADIVGAHTGSPSHGIVTWLGDGAGGFAPRILSAQTSASEPQSLGLGDVNRDGFVDAVYAEAGISIGLGRGDGSFGERQTVPWIAGHVLAVTAGDFDGDGKLDAVGCDTLNSRLVFVKGHGDGTFDPPVFQASARYRMLVAGHFDDNATIDLVGVAATNLARVSWLRGNGDGTFAAPVQINTAGGRPTTLQALDADGDGKLDIVTTNFAQNTVSVIHQTALGLDGFDSWEYTLTNPVAVKYGDLNGDGRMDRVVGAVQWWRVELDNGAGGWTALPSQFQNPNPYDVALADFDADGKLDLAIAQQPGNPALIHLWRGQGGGVFANESIVDFAWRSNEGLGALFAKDFDQDGKIDLAARGGFVTSLVMSARGKGDGTFEPVEVYGSPHTPNALVTGDFDQDGFDDFLGAGSRGGVSTMTFVHNVSKGVVAVPPVPGRTSVALAITRLAPNPSRGAFALDLSAATAGAARVTLVSLAGRVVHDQAVALTAGANRVELSPSGLVPGVYWARAEAFGQAATRKVIVLP